MTTDILNLNFDLDNIVYPKNIFALRIKDEQGNIFDTSILHNGYCPKVYSEREQSNFNDYLSNLRAIERLNYSHNPKGRTNKKKVTPFKKDHFINEQYNIK